MTRAFRKGRRLLPAFFTLSGLFLSVCMLFPSCQKEKGGSDDDGKEEGGETEVVFAKTIGSESISALGATLKGQANPGASAGNGTAMGIDWSADKDFPAGSTTREKAEPADREYNFSIALKGLAPETTYYFRSYLTLAGKDTFGETMSFTTKDLSTLLATLEATGMTTDGAILNAKLDLTDVRDELVSHGFRWGLSEDALDHSLEGETLADGTFHAALGGLSPNTPYWYKAYVKLGDQEFYGETQSFRTEAIRVESIVLDLSKHTFYTVGASVVLHATLSPEDATEKGVAWTSSDENVATVDPVGTVTAVGSGTATITAAATDGGGAKGTCTVTVFRYTTPEVVDLGLSVKWATFNVGATRPEEAGLYFAWGETVPKNDYSWPEYAWCYGNDNTMTKYNVRPASGIVDGKTVLESGDDVASVALGGSFRTPTKEEFQELLDPDNCTWTWTQLNGMAGYKVSGKKEGYTDKWIFLPASGYREGKGTGNNGVLGYYWSSSVNPDSSKHAYSLGFGVADHYWYSFLRCYGLTVRAVTP